MAVYRQVQITFWQDSFVLKLTPEEKFFYLYLLTNSKTKQCGIYELPLSIIQIETGYNRETVIKLIQRFIDHQKIAYDWENEEVFLHNWIKHNPYEKNPKILKCIEKELKSVHNKNLIPLTSPLQGVLQKEKEEQKEKKEEERIISSSDEPTIDEVKHFFDSNGFDIKQGENFYSYYSAQNWETKSGVSIKKNWQRKVIGWMNNQKQFGDNNGRNSNKQRRKDYVTKDEYNQELKDLYEGGN